jgi:hypothetical protein
MDLLVCLISDCGHALCIGSLFRLRLLQMIGFRSLAINKVNIRISRWIKRRRDTCAAVQPLLQVVFELELSPSWY